MPKLKVPSVASMSKSDKAANLHQQLQLASPHQPSNTNDATPPPPIKRGPRMKSCSTVKERKLGTPKLQNGLKANMAFKEVFGCSDDEVNVFKNASKLNIKPHPLSFTTTQEESFLGFTLKMVREEYDKLVVSCRSEGGEEKVKEGRVGGRGERPRRSGKWDGVHYLEQRVN